MFAVFGAYRADEWKGDDPVGRILDIATSLGDVEVLYLLDALSDNPAFPLRSFLGGQGGFYAPADLQSRYEQLPDFLELVREFDPQGRFRNEFLAANLYG